MVFKARSLSLPERSRFKVPLLPIGIALLAVAPLLLYPVFLMKLLCFGLFAAAVNLVLGYGGMVAFGHATFFGGAAYVTAHAFKEWGFGAGSGLMIGVAFALVTGFLMGLIAIRRQGFYFAMTTLALSQMAYFAFFQAPFTHAEDGIQRVPRPNFLGVISLSDNMSLYYFVVIVFLLGMLAIWRVIHSPFGASLTAIRENETRALSLGYQVNRYKLTVFVISAALSGLAGSLKVLVFQIATLTDVSWQMSGEVILMTLLGGVGTFLGPIIGAALVLTIQNYMASTAVPVTIFIGAAFIICVMLFRKGIVGEIDSFMRRERVSGWSGEEKVELQ
ncbi:branched-chain amino acid ABC transporter permease [Microvirga arsenatis]|uniref:Branched-chain amino acid ABC transporter permease n=1 Tax=Microvirga arsenatis TaxID=2692265 RepID=A0ABW9YYE5_9HYPH|nr:branched-chain amino acid ABC transporter permease [Microvirga arsenatis]NBJ11145.1 branched-chain amino acid ABC transporter permease [Microvirga arsenatis]NBJ25418.1 branched-chain amino acid ABC transporter permease [Microvirga arsenatis]